MNSRTRLTGILTLAVAAISVAPSWATTTATTEIVGVQTTSGWQHYAALGLNLINPDLISAEVASNTNSQVVLAGTGLNVGVLLSSAIPAYLEVVDGGLVGERLDVDVGATIAAANGTISIKTSVPNHNTVSPLAANALAGSHVALRNHITIAQIQAMFTPALPGSNVIAQASQVLLLSGGAYDLFYLRANLTDWRNPNTSTTDRRYEPVPPGEGFYVKLPGETLYAATELGVVRDASSFRKNLGSGFQLVSLGYPVDMSPVEIAALPSPGGTWTGSSVIASADQILIPDATGSSLTLYYMRTDGAWRSPLTSTTDHRNSPIIPAGHAFFVKRATGDLLYEYVAPFTP